MQTRQVFTAYERCSREMESPYRYGSMRSIP